MTRLSHLPAFHATSPPMIPVQSVHSRKLPSWPDQVAASLREADHEGAYVVAELGIGLNPQGLVRGHIVEDEGAAIAAVGCLDRLDRATVRARFEQRFTARRMAEDYLETYRYLAADERPLARRRLRIVGSAR